MKTDKTQIAMGAAFLGAFGAFRRWHSPRVKPLTKDEIERYLRIISKLPLPEGHVEPIVESLRTWAEADDGKPVLMLNMIRFYPENRAWPGAPEFQGTPEEANAYYEKSITPLWLKNASYPIAGGDVQGQNLIKTLPDQDPWSAAKMVRYPSRRMFLQLLADPSYGPYEPYKFMSMEIDLVPVKATVIPDPRWLVGGTLLALYLAVGWKRAALG